METEELNMDWVNFIQEYVIDEQLVGDGTDKNDRARDASEGLKKIIKQAFVKHQILGFDSISPLLENNEEINSLYKALSEKSSQESTNTMFMSAINEVKSNVASEYGVGPRRKKPHEILSERLDKTFGDRHIDKNVDKLLEKNVGNGGGDCEDGSCGC